MTAPEHAAENIVTMYPKMQGHEESMARIIAAEYAELVKAVEVLRQCAYCPMCESSTQVRIVNALARVKGQA